MNVETLQIFAGWNLSLWESMIMTVAIYFIPLAIIVTIAGLLTKKRVFFKVAVYIAIAWAASIVFL